MALRIPRGFGVNRPQYQEICEGVRPTAEAVQLKAWTGLPCVRLDDQHNDPIVIDAGTLIGIATGGVASGFVLPATFVTGNQLLYTLPHSESSTWSLPTTSGSITCGLVKPLGVAYQPIYSFYLETAFTNYKRVHSVGYVTDYVIQIPCITLDETNINPGDKVAVGTGQKTGTQDSNWTNALLFNGDNPAGRYRKFTLTSNAANELIGGLGDTVVGRCLKRLHLGTTTDGSPTGLKLSAVTNFTLSAAAAAEFKSMDKVQTVPGLGLAGSGTNGVPSWLMGARANANGDFYALTLLIRL